MNWSITKTFIDIKPGTAPVRINASMYDNNSRLVVMTVKDGGRAFDMTGLSARVEGTRADGTGFMSACTIGDGTVSFLITKEMTNSAGDQKAEIILFAPDNHRIGTANFIIRVEPAALDEDTEISPEDETLINQYITSLTEKIDEAMELVETAEQAAASAEASSGSAAGSADSAQHNALKAEQYASSAKASADRAESTAGNVSAQAQRAESAAAQAAVSASNAAASAAEAGTSANRARNSMVQAAGYQAQADRSASDAQTYAAGANASRLAAESSRRQAAQSASSASSYANAAQSSAESALADAAHANTYSQSAAASATAAEASAEAAAASAEEAESSLSSLADEVTELGNDLTQITNVFGSEINASPIYWEKGNLRFSDTTAPTASSYNASYRARTPVDKPFRCGAGSTITLLPGFYIQVEVYNGTNYSSTPWITSGSYTVLENSLVWVLIRSSATETGDEIPLETLTSGISIVNISSVDKLSSEVAKNATDIATLQNVITETNNVSLVNNSDSVGTGASANTRRWILPYTIPQNSHISTLLYHTASAISGTVIVEIWKKEDNTLVLDKSVTSTPTASSVNTVDINYQAETDVMIGWRMESGTSLRHNGGTEFVIWAFDDLSSNSLSINNKTIFDIFKPCVTVNYTTTSLKNFVELPETVLTIGEGMEYEQIQDAINAITDDSAEKPYTLLVMPKGTSYEPFSMLRASFDDTYPWSNIAPRYISIIGLDKENCVIRSDSGNYKLPCGEPMLNGSIKNLTFVMTNDNQDPNATQGGYCLHIDCRTANDVGYNMTIEDCDFEDASGPCLGISMHKNCTLTIRRCNFHTTLSANYAPFEGYRNLSNYGVIFCHSSTLADSTNQNIIIDDCSGICEEGDKGLWLAVAGDYDPSTASFYYRLLRNVFWNKTQNAPSYSISSTLTADPMNFGNNMP